VSTHGLMQVKVARSEREYPMPLAWPELGIRMHWLFFDKRLACQFSTRAGYTYDSNRLVTGK